MKEQYAKQCKDEGAVQSDRDDCAAADVPAGDTPPAGRYQADLPNVPGPEPSKTKHFWLGGCVVSLGFGTLLHLFVLCICDLTNLR